MKEDTRCERCELLKSDVEKTRIGFGKDHSAHYLCSACVAKLKEQANGHH